MFRRTAVPMLLTALLLAACGDDGDGAADPLATLRVRVVVDGTGAAIADARVLVIDADTGAPAGPSLRTDRDGRAVARVEPGGHLLRVDAAGHHPRPLPGAPGVPLRAAAGETVEREVELLPRDAAAGRTLEGRVRTAQGGIGGVLVVAEGPATATAVTDADGGFLLFDLPAGTYVLRALLAGHAGAAVSAEIPDDRTPEPAVLSLARGGTGSLAGHVTFLATQNGTVRVTLLDRASGEAVPGLSAPATDGTYVLEGIPPGDYTAWAALENEAPVGYVMDPDAIRKSGVPEVTVAAGARTERDFDVTGAVILESPAADDAGPVRLAAPPSFRWTPYPSADRYFVEVADELGRVVWGGFAGDSPRVEIPKTVSSIQYGAGATDAGPLEPGRAYRFRVFAAKADAREPTGWILLSASEDQRGLFEVE